MPKFERACFTLMLASAVMVVATVSAPGLQRLVAPVACPSGTDASYVVRVPHDPDPTAMVRNSPLVCVDGTDATVASPVRTLGSWFLLGVPIGYALTRVVQLVARVVAAGRREVVAGEAEAQPLTGSARTVTAMAHPPSMAGRSFMALFATFATLMAGPSLWAWLALDDPYRSYSCNTGDGGRGTCANGELVYRWFAIVSLSVAAVLLAAYVVLRVRHARRRARLARLVHHGRDGVATLVRADRTNTKVNGRQVSKWVYEVDPGDGGPTFEMVERGLSSPAGSIGGRLRVRWDPEDRTNVMILSQAPDLTPA